MNTIFLLYGNVDLSMMFKIKFKLLGICVVFFQAGSLVCPMDRQITDVGSGGVWSLKKNFALIELMEKLQLGGITHIYSSSASHKEPHSDKQDCLLVRSQFTNVYTYIYCICLPDNKCDFQQMM